MHPVQWPLYHRLLQRRGPPACDRGGKAGGAARDGGAGFHPPTDRCLCSAPACRSGGSEWNRRPPEGASTTSQPHEATAVWLLQRDTLGGVSRPWTRGGRATSLSGGREASRTISPALGREHSSLKGRHTGQAWPRVNFHRAVPARTLQCHPDPQTHPPPRPQAHTRTTALQGHTAPSRPATPRMRDGVNRLVSGTGCSSLGRSVCRPLGRAQTSAWTLGGRPGPRSRMATPSCRAPAEETPMSSASLPKCLSP